MSKKKVIHTHENSFDNSKISNKNTSVKKYTNINIKKKDNLFYKRIEKILKKKPHMTSDNKTKRRFNNYSVNNSFIHFQKQLGNKLYNNFNLNDKSLSTKAGNLSKYKDKSYLGNRNLMIECGYSYKHKTNNNISGDKFIYKKKTYISSVPCSNKKNKNKKNYIGIPREKEINSLSSKRSHGGINSSLGAKHKTKIKTQIKASLYKNKGKENHNFMTKSNETKKNSSYNLALSNTVRRTGNESMLNKTASNYKLKHDLKSFDLDMYKESIKANSKINKLREEIEKMKNKLNSINDYKTKSIKISKNNPIEKGSKNSLNTVVPKNKNNKNKNSIKEKNYKKINDKTKNNTKKTFKIKTRLQSCKFSNEQISKIQKDMISDNNNNKHKKKLSEKTTKINNNKGLQSTSTKERKNITFFNNYMKNNNVYIHNKKNMNQKHYHTNSNISSYVNNNNNSAIIRNTNTNKTNYPNLNTSNKKKKKSSLYKNPIAKEADFLNKLKTKLKTNPITTIHSKDNSKTNIICEDLLNSSTKNSKQACSTNNTNINNKIINNTKKIFINNIINVNANSDNNNCITYRVMGTDKILSYKHRIIDNTSRTPCLDYSYTNKSQKRIYQNQMNKSKHPIKETNNNKNKNENKNKESNNNNINKKDKKSKMKDNQKYNNTKIKINKDLIKKKINIKNDKNDLSSVAFLLNSNQKNLSNIFKNLNREIISENITIETNPSLVSTLKECTYYKQECENLSSYIKQYYEKHKAYPTTDQNFYKYGRVLGKGAFGKVNLALHLASGRLVAIKSFNKKKLTTKRAKRKIKTEIEALSKLRNPFCTQIYDFFETDTHILIVMEYVCGDLLGFIKKMGKISESTAKIIFKQIIKGLQYIHKKKIVHRDIKLDNVLIDLTNTVKICDFGVCRILQPGDIMYEHCGTPAYIAPEIFKDEGYEGFSCDIWSAGVTLHYMLAGTQPFRANKIEDLKEIILKGEYERIEDVSNEANDLINGMLQLNPKKRLSIEDILRHPWLKNVDIKKRKNLNIFTNAEKGLLSKFDVNYLSSPKEELIEVFTVSNLITKEEKEEKGATKSDILAPYNSYAKKSDENDLYSDLKIENELCRFNFKAQLSNIKYELSNNQEFDNGIIKTIYNSVEGGNKKNNEEFENENTHTLNLSLDSIATFTGGLCDDIIKDIEEFIGYDKKYLVQCLRKNEINYATATYYLMLRDEMNSHY